MSDDAPVKTSSREEAIMIKAQVGDILYCPDCQFEAQVIRACDCEGDCVIKCCDTPLKVRKAGEPREAGKREDFIKGTLANDIAESTGQEGN
jgi:hypothetical protein